MDASNKQVLDGIEIRVSPRKIFVLLIKIILFLLSSHLASQLLQRFAHDFFGRDTLFRLFDLDREANIPAAYSALTLLFAAVILGFIAVLKKRTKDEYALYWRSLSLVFGFLSLDELVSLHETMVAPSKQILHSLGIGTGGILYFTWVVPGMLILCFFLLVFWRFVMHLPRKVRNYFLMSGSMYIGGALGCEFIGGYAADLYRSNSIPYLLVFTLEEFLEMLGIATFIYGLLLYLSHYMGLNALRFCSGTTVLSKNS